MSEQELTRVVKGALQAPVPPAPPVEKYRPDANGKCQCPEHAKNWYFGQYDINGCSTCGGSVY